MNSSGSIESTTAELEILQRQVDHAATCAQRMWGVIQLLLLRTRGVEELNRFKTQILRRHQRAHFLSGVDKLEIDRSLPPAIVAGRYHYLSNRIGGLEMEYVEESQQKVWIRYLPPCWSFTGISLAAVPSSVQRSMFAGWHPHNGLYLNAPGLRFVVTKVYQDGEPYDEGYFEDVGRPLDVDERLVCRPAVRSPDFDPGRAPELDPVQWPPRRLALAKRKFAAAYYFDGVDTCFERYGIAETGALLATAFRIYWTQFLNEIRTNAAVPGSDAQALVALVRHHCESTGERLEVEREGKRYRLKRENRALAGARFPEEVHTANASFVSALAYILSPRVRTTLGELHVDDSGIALENWTIEDTAERLY